MTAAMGELFSVGGASLFLFLATLAMFVRV